ncbi:MAG: SurA N-terminal domain-containing protein [Vicinamibacterales bacterium]|nr:SurA N-terminal domain-containing protein [Vicinamibacterales bacterium]
MGSHAGRRRRSQAAAIALAVLTAWAAAPVRGAQVVDRVVAIVSGTVILLSDARAELELGLLDPGAARDPIEAAMQRLIDRRLVLDEAGRGDRVDVDPAALGQALDGMRQRFASDAEYRRALAGLGLDERGLQRLVRDTLTARQYVERRFDSVLPPTEEELREYYASHAARFVRNGRQLTFDDALADLTAILQRERREQAESAWMDRLRRRADIREVYQSRPK